MKRKIMNIGTMGIVVIILLAGVLNCKQMVETKTKERGTEEIRTEEIETEYMSKQDSSIIYETIKEFDFSPKEYPINWEIYTPQVEQEYKEAFYMTITNQIPLEYEEEGTVYFRDHLRGVADLDDIEFVEQFVKNSKYRFIDCDGDGLPELLMDTAINGFCILKYRLKEQKVEAYHWLDEYEVLLGSNQIGYCNPTSANNTRYGYKILNESGEVEYEIYFTVYHGEDGMQYEIFTSENESMSGYLNQEQWDEVTKDFFAMLGCPVTMAAYEEAFGRDFIGTEVLHGNMDEAMRVYDEFLAGERMLENPGGRTIADMDDGNMKYLIYDINGDHIPELHIQTAGDYYILAYRNNVLFILFHEQVEEALKYYGVCKSGEIVYKYTIENEESYSFYKFEFSGNEYKTIGFYRNDSNGNGVYDEDDEYECNGDICTLEEWISRAEGYLCIHKNGDVQVLDLIEWKDDTVLNSMEKEQNLQIRNEVYSLKREKTENLQAPYYVMVNFPQLEDAGDLDMDINKVNLLIKDAAFSMYGETSAEAITRLEGEVRDLNAYEGTVIDHVILQLENDYISLAFYAVHREMDEVLREQEWSDIECKWLYNDAYKKAAE